MDASNVHYDSLLPHPDSLGNSELYIYSNTPQQLNTYIIPDTFTDVTLTQYLHREVLPITQIALSNFANSPDLSKNIELAFGYGCNVEFAHRIVDNLASGQEIPDIQIIPQSQLKADGAFGNNTIYLSLDLFNPQQSNSSQVVNVLLEEM